VDRANGSFNWALSALFLSTSRERDKYATDPSFQILAYSPVLLNFQFLSTSQIPRLSQNTWKVRFTGEYKTDTDYDYKKRVVLL
jgi:hypothetical protein